MRFTPDSVTFSFVPSGQRIPTVMALAGHVSRAKMERYSHIRMEAKRKAVDTLSGANFEPGVAQNWAQFFCEREVRRS